MNKIISYSLFDKKKNYDEMRSWDEHKHLSSRYWTNIPTLVLVNTLLYPKYEMKLFIHPSIKENPLFPLLSYLDTNKEHFNFSLVELSLDYSGREPSLWRFIPIWDKNREVVLTKDLDSLPNTSELKCSRLFELSDCEIMTIRSHPNHNHQMRAVRMLAGLSGFKPSMMGDIGEYESFYQHALTLWEWGLDQEALIEHFLEKKSYGYLVKKFMDCAVDYRKDNSMWPCFPINEKNILEINLSELDKKVMGILDKLTDWAGKPIDSRSVFEEIVELSETKGSELKNFILSNQELKDFYGVSD